MKSKRINLIVIIVFITIVIDFIRILVNSGETTFAYATYLSAFFMYFAIIVLIRLAFKSGFFSDTPRLVKFLFLMWFLINIFNLFRSFILATDYWDLKVLFLSSFSFSFIALAIFLGENLNNIQIVLKYVLKYVFVWGILFIPVSLTYFDELYPRIMIMSSLFILFIPYLKYKWKFLIIFVSIVSIILSVSFRSNIIRILFSYIIILTFYLWSYKRDKILKITNIILYILPLALFYLAIWGNFNIYNEIAQFKNLGIITTSSTGLQENLAADTRTFLYNEVFVQLSTTKNWLLGEGAAGSYKSKVFYNTGGAILGTRYSTEVGILNVLLRYGLLGVFSYFILLFYVSYLGIYKSNNDLSKLLAVFISSRWLLSFIEEFTDFNLNFLFFWIVVGLLSTNKFRILSNGDIKEFFKSV